MRRFSAFVCPALTLAMAVWAQTSSANDGLCNEAPTATLDGIPAYAMCTAASTSDVWSNDGVHTAGSSQGSAWVQTAYGNGYQCTELAGRYMYFVWNIPPDWIQGDAKDICSLQMPTGLELSTTPMHGDLAVFPASCDGASATTGHVAVVESVSSNGNVKVIQQNVAGTASDDPSCIACYVHATANTGAPLDAGAPDTGATDANVEPDALSSIIGPDDASTSQPSPDAAPPPQHDAGAPDGSASGPKSGGMPPADASLLPAADDAGGPAEDGFGPGSGGGGGCQFSEGRPEGGQVFAGLALVVVAAGRRGRRRKVAWR